MPVQIDGRFVSIKMAERGWSLGHLATVSGIHENTLRRLMRGEVFNSDTLGRLAKALDVAPVDLIEKNEVEFSRPHMDAPALSSTAA